MIKGVIYVFTNPSFSNLIKIGYTNNVHRRLNQLNQSSGIPRAYHIYATYEVEQEFSDKKLHELIDKLNPDLRIREIINGRTRTREFYEMSAEDAYRILECIAIISGTQSMLKRYSENYAIPNEQISNSTGENTRRGPFRFSDCHIPLGSKIAFIDDPSILATVIDDRHIEYQGETTSTSALAQKLKGYSNQPQGPNFFTYNGEKLTDLRARIEASQRE